MYREVQANRSYKQTNTPREKIGKMEERDRAKKRRHREFKRHGQKENG